MKFVESILLSVYPLFPNKNALTNNPQGNNLRHAADCFIIARQWVSKETAIV